MHRVVTIRITRGWTFRTGMIDPDKFPRLLLEFEALIGRAFYAVLDLKLFKTFPKTNRWDRLFFLISELVEL